MIHGVIKIGDGGRGEVSVVVSAGLVSAPEIWRQADKKFKDILGCRRPCLKKGRGALGEEEFLWERE